MRLPKEAPRGTTRVSQTQFALALAAAIGRGPRSSPAVGQVPVRRVDDGHGRQRVQTPLKSEVPVIRHARDGEGNRHQQDQASNGAWSVEDLAKFVELPRHAPGLGNDFCDRGNANRPAMHDGHGPPLA